MSNTMFGIQLQNLLGVDYRDFLLPVGEIPVYMDKSSNEAIGSAIMDTGRFVKILNISVPEEIKRSWHLYRKTYDSTVIDDDKTGNYLRKRLDNIILHKNE